MEQQYIIIITWLTGACWSWWMLVTEHEAEKEVFTNGDKVLCVFLSLLSWLMVFIILVRAWIAQIGSKGYWEKPVQDKKTE